MDFNFGHFTEKKKKTGHSLYEQINQSQLSQFSFTVVNILG